ncbi:MAG: NTP transferase domain-containing protein, partial [Planctomycetota bacterium]
PSMTALNIGGLRADHQDVALVTGKDERYESFGFRVITDQPVGIGPMGGLHAALSDRFELYGEGWLVLAACDLVQPQHEWIAPLTKQISSTTAHAIAYRGNQWEPMLALYHTDLLPSIQQLIKQRIFAMHRLLDRVDAHAVELPFAQGSIPQANTPAEFKTAQLRGVA